MHPKATTTTTKQKQKTNEKKYKTGTRNRVPNKIVKLQKHLGMSMNAVFLRRIWPCYIFVIPLTDEFLYAVYYP